MPPGGQSPWHHSSDSYHLRGDGDPLWGIVQLPLSRDRLELLLPLDDPHSYRRVLAVETGGGGATFEVAERTLRSRGGELVATIEVSAESLAVIDAGGLTRLHVRLGPDADPAWPASGERGVLGAGAASFCIPTGPGARVSVHAVSMP